MHIKIYLISILLLSGLFSEVSAQKWRIKRLIQEMEEKNQEHTGFMLFDPAKGKVLYERKADKYYTPASNTKIFTMYTSFKVLGDSIPGLYYKYKGDSLIIWGSGDPSFLYENLPQNPEIFEFLIEGRGDIFYSDLNFQDTHFGPGWSWADYTAYYQVERSPFPIYGNYFYVLKDRGSASLRINNPVFKRYFNLQDSLVDRSPIIRDYGSNKTDYFPQSPEVEFTKLVPFKYSPYLLTQLLEDTLKRRVRVANEPLTSDYQTSFSIPIDSAFKVLMETSDNFIAEQLLLTSAGVLSDTLNSDIAINWAKKNILNDLPDEPLWYDGSGLSRYNQFTPRSIVSLWNKLYDEMGEKRLFPLLATGGVKGTIRNWYGAETPYIYAKTGTLKNHHALSGFIVTEKGKVLIFSFMNGHFPNSSSSVKEGMQEILELIYDRY